MACFFLHAGNGSYILDNMRLYISKYRIAAIIFLCLILAVVGSAIYVNKKMYLTKLDNEAEKMQKLFNQPQWRNINFQEGISEWSMRPFLGGNDKQKIEKATVASREAGIKQPIIPYFGPKPQNPNAYYFHAQFKRPLSDSLGYELRFIAYADYETLDPVYSIWISAIPQVIDEYKNYINMPEQKEFIYSVYSNPTIIENEMKQYFISKGLMK